MVSKGDIKKRVMSVAAVLACMAMVFMTAFQSHAWNVNNNNPSNGYTTNYMYRYGYHTICITNGSETGYLTVTVDYGSDCDKANGNKTSSAKWRDASHTVGLSAESSGSFNIQLESTSASTVKNDSDSYTNIRYYITFTMPAHYRNVDFAQEPSLFSSVSGFSATRNLTSNTAFGLRSDEIGWDMYHDSDDRTRRVQVEINLINSGVVYPGSNMNDIYSGNSDWTTLTETYKSGSTTKKYYYRLNYVETRIVLARDTRTIYFNGNGGTASATSTTVYDGAEVGWLPTATRTGYNFEGWSTSPGGTDTVDTDFSTCADTTLYAVWEAQDYYVDYDCNGSASSISTTTLTRDLGGNLSSSSPTRPGYTFLGWATSKRGDVAYQPGDSVNNLAAEGETLTLYAQWKKSDASWNTSKIYDDDKMFYGSGNIVGGNGTVYDSGKVDSEWARPDTEDQQGYFTAK